MTTIIQQLREYTPTSQFISSQNGDNPPNDEVRQKLNTLTPEINAKITDLTQEIDTYLGQGTANRMRDSKKTDKEIINVSKNVMPYTNDFSLICMEPEMIHIVLADRASQEGTANDLMNSIVRIEDLLQKIQRKSSSSDVDPSPNAMSPENPSDPSPSFPNLMSPENPSDPSPSFPNSMSPINPTNPLLFTSSTPPPHTAPPSSTPRRKRNAVAPNSLTPTETIKKDQSRCCLLM